jgi:hypothetical protein
VDLGQWDRGGRKSRTAAPSIRSLAPLATKALVIELSPAVIWLLCDGVIIGPKNGLVLSLLLSPPLLLIREHQAPFLWSRGNALGSPIASEVASDIRPAYHA